MAYAVGCSGLSEHNVLSNTSLGPHGRILLRGAPRSRPHRNLREPQSLVLHSFPSSPFPLLPCIRKYDSLIQDQARELSYLRQKIREGRGICYLLAQHAKDTVKSFEDLLRSNDIDYYLGQSFREHLAQGSQLTDRLTSKLSTSKLAAGLGDGLVTPTAQVQMAATRPRQPFNPGSHFHLLPWGPLPDLGWLVGSTGEEHTGQERPW